MEPSPLLKITAAPEYLAAEPNGNVIGEFTGAGPQGVAKKCATRNYEDIVVVKKNKGTLKRYHGGKVPLDPHNMSEFAIEHGMTHKPVAVPVEFTPQDKEAFCIALSHHHPVIAKRAWQANCAKHQPVISTCSRSRGNYTSGGGAHTRPRSRSHHTGTGMRAEYNLSRAGYGGAGHSGVHSRSRSRANYGGAGQGAGLGGVRSRSRAGYGGGGAGQGAGTRSRSRAGYGGAGAGYGGACSSSRAGYGGARQNSRAGYGGGGQGGARQNSRARAGYGGGGAQRTASSRARSGYGGGGSARSGYDRA